VAILRESEIIQYDFLCPIKLFILPMNMALKFRHNHGSHRKTSRKTCSIGGVKGLDISMIRKSAPILIGEFGAIDFSTKTISGRWMKAFTDYLRQKGDELDLLGMESRFSRYRWPSHTRSCHSREEENADHTQSN